MCEDNYALILLCGGKGQRMGSTTPKQYLLLKNKPIALYSYEFFVALKIFKQIIVVCEKDYQHLFPKASFASPGNTRQDSVYNGYKLVEEDTDIVCIHDGARSFLEKSLIDNLMIEAKNTGAATLGIPATNTIKLCNENIVEKTLDRKKLFEIQTPQALKLSILKQGFDKARENKLTVTDDVSLAELIGQKVKIVEGSKKNIKITTPFDLTLANFFLSHETL